MRNVSTASILLGNSSASINGTAIDANQWINLSVQLVASAGDEVGTIKVQISNQLPPSNSARSLYTPTVWSDVPNATAAVATGAAAAIVVSNLAAQWVRVVYTSTSGGAAASMTILVNAAGA